jgi:Zn-dependent peptidase ImmA (M78 family)/transcriptional regulator with XRE-family HTH domain
MQEHVLDKINPRILGQRLQDTRKARGLTQQDAANELGVARTTITALEKGERRIQPDELINLARLYGREVGDLVSSRRILGDFAVQFRASMINTGQNKSKLEQAVFEFQQLCEDYLNLENICKSPIIRNYPPEYSPDGLDIDQVGEDIATLERHRLGFGDGPLLNLRESMENDVGIRIFYLKLPSNVSGMFTYSEELGGCLAINSSHPEERRRWSIAHEYGHFLTHRFQSEVSILMAYDRVPATERIADSFAGAFLMPATGLRHRYNDLSRIHKGQITPADLCRLANYYFVSVEALALRLEALRLVQIGAWERLQERGFKVREAQEILSLESHSSMDQTLPLRYQYLAVEAYQQGDLSEGQLTRFLRVDRLEARRIVQRLSCQMHVSEGGDIESLDVDFSRTAQDKNDGGILVNE